MSQVIHRIEIDKLRLGLFIHLDLGWFAHPFPLSSFKIESEDQLRTLRTLGLKTLRWDPARSDPEPAPEVAASPSDDADAADAAAAEAAESDTTMTAAQQAASAAARAAEKRRELLARQHELTRQTEAQYGEAGAACQHAHAMVAAQPVVARQQSEALAQALLDKMLGEGDLCIRVLNAGAGDRTTAHAMNVTVISMLLGRSVGLQSDELQHLGVGALLHDIGKASLPERVRHADQASGQAEQQSYREHVELGMVQARRMGLAAPAMRIVAQHHEMADGSGFPLGSEGERIAMAARVVALVNRFDNLCNPAVLSRALTPHEALSLLFAQGRNKFDPTLLNAFIRMMGVYPAGSVVQLTDDRYAVVVSVNSIRPLKPRVLVHDPKVPVDEALVVDLETLPDLGIRRSLRAAQLPPAALQYLSPRPRLTYFFEPGAVAKDSAAADDLLHSRPAAPA